MIDKLIVYETCFIYILLFVMSALYESYYSNIISTEWVTNDNCVIINQTTHQIKSDGCPYKHDGINITFVNWYAIADNKVVLGCANYYAESYVYCSWYNSTYISKPSYLLNGLPAIFCSRCMDFNCAYINYESPKCYLSKNNKINMFKFDTLPYFPKTLYYVLIVFPICIIICFIIPFTTTYFKKHIEYVDQIEYDENIHYSVSLHVYCMLVIHKYIIPIILGIFIIKNVSFHYYSEKNNIFLILLFNFWFYGIINQLTVAYNVVKLVRNNNDWVDSFLPLGICALAGYNRDKRMRFKIMLGKILYLHFWTQYVPELILLTSYNVSYGWDGFSIWSSNFISYLLVGIILYNYY